MAFTVFLSAYSGGIRSDAVIGFGSNGIPSAVCKGPFSSAVETLPSGSYTGSLTFLIWPTGSDIAFFDDNSCVVAFDYKAVYPGGVVTGSVTSSVRCSHIEIPNTDLGVYYSSIQILNLRVYSSSLGCPPPSSVECDESNPCPEGERCVDGVCEPCESIQATHYQIRWEFDRIVALDSDGNSGNYHLSQIFQIPSGGVDDVVHRFAGFLAPYVSSRIRFCDANGAIKPYRGSGYIAHVLNADGSGTLMGNTSFSASNPDVLYTAVTPLTQALADGAGTTSVNTLVSFSASDEVLSDDCETIEPPGDDDDDEVELPEGEEPPDGEDPPGKKDGEKGKRKDDPDLVETCECYDIINQRLTDINNNIAILNDNILEQMQVHNDTFAILITKMQEWTRYLSSQWREIMFEKDKYDNLRQKRLKQFLTSGSGEKIADSVQRATDALYVSDSGSAHDGDSIADLHDSVFHSSLNENMSITDAIENIEPVHIENEYRTQSHRVIDNFDSTQNL